MQRVTERESQREKERDPSRFRFRETEMCER